MEFGAEAADACAASTRKTVHCLVEITIQDYNSPLSAS